MGSREPSADAAGAQRQGERSVPRLSRRAMLAATATTGATALAGCSGGGAGSAGPAAVTVPEGATCDVCGMVIAQHPGPTSEVFYADERPNGHDNPARFDSTWEAFQYDFEHDEWDREGFYVTDYTAVDYDIRTDGDQQLISRHIGEETFVDATAATFVADSAVAGTMGADLIGFSTRADAEAFQDEHGGDLVTFDQVTETLIGQLGR